ncbi:MAG: anti-sigma factor [Bacteroidetes bacterium]|nr:MAG: anti-sigma factor [Bacteroidota bacterium]
MMSCQVATRLMEKQTEEKLSFREQLALTMHKLLCRACREYEKQSRLIGQFLSRSKPAPKQPDEETDIRDLETNIIEQLNKKL